MFVSIYFPFVDLRRICEDQFGRSPRPDWRTDEPKGFVRHFGGVVNRNAKGYGLIGERAYLEFEHALAFPKPGVHLQPDWPSGIPLRLWYRRMYFDGDISGRFEIGFRTDPNVEEDLFKKGVAPCDVGALARSLSDIEVEIRSGDGSRTTAKLERSAEPLGLAYLVATTLLAKASTYPANELSGKTLVVGRPSIHMRIGGETPIIVPQDRQDIMVEGDDHFFVTSVANAQRRNTVTVQLSPAHGAESAQERARRVLFAHLNSMLYANDFLAEHMDRKAMTEYRVELRDLVSRTIDRFGAFRPTGPKVEDDWKFAGALKAFAQQNEGRVDEIVERLETLAKSAEAPGRLQRIGTWVKGWTEFATNSAIEAGVKATLSPG